MTLYSGQITQMIQGVSQQHSKDRAEGQIGEQVNCISDIVSGLRRRPALKVLSELTGITTLFALDAETAVYSYSRGDGTEEYIMLFDKLGRIKIYDALTGAEKTVTNSNAAYLTTTDPAKNLRFHTIGDSTFILNVEKEPIMDVASTEESDPLGFEALVYCVKASYGHIYTIKIDDVEYAKVTLSPTVVISATAADKSTTLSSTNVMEYLVNGGAPSPHTQGAYINDGTLAAIVGHDWDWELKEDVLHIHDNQDFQISVNDGNHGADLKATRNAVPAFEDMPKYAPMNYKIEVKGTGDERFDNYWVEWIPDSEDSALWDGTGVWQECIGAEIKTTLDGTYMPTKIVRNADGTFTNDEETWVKRAAGDDTTNPVPSFVNIDSDDHFTILDLGSYQNRMYFLTGENVVMSRSFDHLALFAESVAAPADDDPIDSASSDNQVTDLLHSAIFDGALVLFSNNAQFIHPKDIAVTPGLFAVASDTKFNVSPNVKPVVTGTNIMFPTDFGNFTNVWEYNLNTQTGSPQCEAVTKHIPRYIGGNPKQMIANTTTDYVFLRTDEDNTTIYVQQFYVKETKRAQLSWHKWTVDAGSEIVSMTLLNQRLFLVLTRNSKVYLEYIDLSLPLTANSDFELYIDHYYSGLVTYGPYDFSTGTEIVTYQSRIALAETGIATFIQGQNCTNEGFPILDYHIDSGYVYFDVPSGGYVIQGHPFESSGTFTNPYVRDGEGRPYTKRTILEEATFNVQRTGFVTFTIEHAAGVDYDHDFNGMLLNNWQFNIGIASELDTDVHVPIRDYRELVTMKFSSEHQLGFSLMSIDWTARMTTRGRRSQ